MENIKSLLDAYIERGSKGFFSLSLFLTPQIAEDLLRRNPANRSISERRVALYAADILADKWAFNGEPIIISKDGKITNGQHRCAAVVRAGRGIQTALAFGVEYESRLTTDQCRAKHAGDFAGMAGVPNAQGVAAIASMVLACDAMGSVQRMIQTPAQVLEFISDNLPELQYCASYSHARVRRLKGMVSPSVMGFCHFVTRRKNAVASDEYITQVITGENLAINDPAMVVRNRLVAMGRGSKQVKAEIILRGWNAFRQGKTRTIAKSLGSLPELI